MKKILPFLFIATLALTAAVVPTASVQAQRTLLSDNGLALDTVETGDLTKTLVLSSQFSSTFTKVEFTLTVTKISGTVGGTATLQGSMNGTDWYTVPGTSAYTITDGTQTTAFKVADYCDIHLRLRVVGTGTMSASIKGQANGRR